MPSLADVVLLAGRVFSDLIAPTHCAACNEGVSSSVLFCSSCVATVERWREHSLDGHAVFEYGGAVSEAVARLKYQRRSELGPRLGRAMAASAEHLRGQFDVVVPVPLHPRRFVERGFNQSALLASPVSKTLHVRLARRALERTRDTPQQVRLDRGERLENLQGAFAVVDARIIQGARVLLVDDVQTTGATLEACTQALTKGGAARVDSLVLARRA